MQEQGGARQGDRWHGDSNDHGHPHSHDHSGVAHGHAHGAVDPTILTTARGIRAIKWSFVGLFIPALFQVVVVWLSDSVALLADTIHNFGDAATAVPLWVAFTLARRRPSKRFTYGYGRVEDLAGVAIVGVIPKLTVAEGHEIAVAVARRLLENLRFLSHATTHVDPVGASGEGHHRGAVRTRDDAGGA